MGTFLFKLALFLILQIGIFGVSAGLYTRMNPFFRGVTLPEAEQTLLAAMPRERRFDVVILGTSRARTFSRYGNHARLERITGKSFFNLAKDGAGVVPEKVLLETFFARGNRVARVVYMISPWVLYSRRWNEGLDFFTAEPFDAVFTYRLMRNAIQPNLIQRYLQANVTWSRYGQPKWAFPDRMDRQLGKISAARIKLLLDYVYPDGRDPSTLRRYMGRLEDLIGVARGHDAAVTLMLTPTFAPLLSTEERFMASLGEVAARHGVPIVDASSALLDPVYFSDHEHLNTAGVEAFSRRFLAGW